MKIQPSLSWLLAMIFLCSQPAFSHGETKPGPHGGYIRMPGAFHTEVIPEKNGLKVMLLDINFEHPTVENSSIKATIQSSTHSTMLKCKTHSDFFFCPIAMNKLQQGTLVISPMRQKAEGAIVEYSLPLKHENEHHEEG